jgi:hypothetical protein
VTGTNLFGPSVGRGHVREWAIGGLKAWLPDYLREAERAQGYPVGQAQLPRAWQVVGRAELTKWPETKLPAVIVQVPGLSDAGPRREGDGDVSAQWIVAPSAIVRGRDEADTERLAEVYGLALRLLMLQQAGDFLAAGGAYVGPMLRVDAVEWADEGYDDIAQRRARTLVAATVTFRVDIRGVASTAYGPGAPSLEPTDDPGPWPEVTDTDLQLTRRPL